MAIDIIATLPVVGIPQIFFCGTYQAARIFSNKMVLI
jgi:hypothetical protein